MRITESSLKNPVAVAMAVAMVCIIGLTSLFGLPLQLFPDIERPQMMIQSAWRTASPQEMESEIVEPIEAVMQGLPGLVEIASNTNAGFTNIVLTFEVGGDMDAMLVEILARLNRLPPMPRDATPPMVSSGADTATGTLSFFFVQQLPGTPGDILDYRRFVEERIVPRISAVKGVSGIEVRGGGVEELSVALDLDRLAALGISIPDVVAQVGRASDVSGGLIEDGRREYLLRLAGRYSPESMAELILAWRDGRPVRLADVAVIEVVQARQRVFQYQNGNPAIGLNIRREHGANVLSTLAEVKRVVEELREEELLPRGLDIAQSFDASVFIHRAIGLLSGSLLAGMLLAVGGMWCFLRDARTTAMIAFTIPVSLLATFIVLKITGRTLNVISLAGLAFAVGMVMDAALVVAENIMRLRERGMSAYQAALDGTRQVGGALFASTATTVAVFLPVVFMDDIEGQLFSDLALTISVAVCVSMLVAVAVLPVGAANWLRVHPGKQGESRWSGVADWAMRITAGRHRQLAWSTGLVIAPLLLAWWLMPRVDYLPPVKRSAVDATFSFPPGMSPERVNREMVPLLMERLRPYMDGSRSPQMSNWYLSVWPGGGTIGARTTNPGDIAALERVIREEVIVDLPDTRAFAREGELFGGFGGSARAIAIHLQHADGEALLRAAEDGRRLLGEHFPGANVQMWPNIGAGTPELRILPDDRRLAEAGWGRQDLAAVIRTLGDGQWLGEHFDGDRRLSVILRTGSAIVMDTLTGVPLVTPSAGVLALGELARVETVLTPSQLRRVDRRRTISLTIDPPAAMSLDEAIERVEGEVVPALRGVLPDDATIRVAGSADRLDAVVKTMSANLAMALLALFMLMAALFRSARDSAYVMASLPMALLGGILGLRVLDLVAGQTLDLLSMIGFVMLIGMVINNAILLVAQTRDAQRQDVGLEDALRFALQQRLRPILIAALTGVLGALPLALNPGPGAVIYRGIAAVSIGGVLLSLLFTVVLVPALMRLFEARATARASASVATDAPTTPHLVP